MMQPLCRRMGNDWMSDCQDRQLRHILDVRNALLHQVDYVPSRNRTFGIDEAEDVAGQEVESCDLPILPLFNGL